MKSLHSDTGMHFLAMFISFNITWTIIVRVDTYCATIMHAKITVRL